MDATTIPTGMDLVTSWYGSDKHERVRECPTCGDDVMTVGITKLVYRHEVCRCGTPEYEHLVERIYHAVCFPYVGACLKFNPFPARGRRSASKECADCGRTEASHTEVPV